MTTDPAPIAPPAAADGLRYSAELAQRVNDEAAHAVPPWFWAAGTAVVAISAAASALWPWGWAS